MRPQPRTTGSAIPATPSTPAQRERWRRIVDETLGLLREGGKDAVQMKELSVRSGVALATLYRYFPSKQHLLLGVLLHNYRLSQEKFRKQPPLQGTPRERVATYLLRAFNYDMRHPEFNAAIQSVYFEATSGAAQIVEEISTAQLRTILAAVGPLSDAQMQVLPAVLALARAAGAQWVVGTLSQSEVRFQILSACRLLEIPEEAVFEDLRAAQTNSMPSDVEAARADRPRTDASPAEASHADA
ncbi:TetR/AcrR family transcriptional regulator [Microbacterium sp. No. 7]|uniref:TetR/AcrR family transcriptional regulator n=1 Tax=Microbacterium sp. No. 7 TaxID=1714373 RepID=UPI0006D234E7|nr:TetR/AcrR family transcriptional regulator [Microbacterium sp. No. 7]ALJ21197.1 hypothetical protein AOA12_15320 [Microbacterium sp. No. 7]